MVETLDPPAPTSAPDDDLRADDGPEERERRRARLAVRRVRRRRRRIALVVMIGACVAGFAALGWTVVTRSGVLAVQRVTVTGTVHADAEAIRADAMEVAGGRSLLGLDRTAITRRIARRPWVADVRVSADWPHTLRVVVNEAQPVLSILTDGRPAGQVLVDGDGRILAAGPAARDQTGPADPSGDVPLLAGQGATVPASLPVGAHVEGGALDAARLAAALPAPWRERTARIGVLRDAAALSMRGGPTVRVGTVDELADKLRIAAEISARVGAAKLIDVTVPRQPAVRTDGLGPQPKRSTRPSEPTLKQSSSDGVAPAPSP